MSSAFRRLPILLIVCGCIITMMSVGTRNGFGLFLSPVSADLGWGREVFAFGIALQNLVWGLGQPLAGAIADKFGSGRTISVAAVCYVVGLALMSTTTSAASFNVSAGLLIGLGLAGTGYGVVLATLGKSVTPERRGMVIGLGTAAGSLGQFAVVPVGQALLEAVGWQTSFLWAAIAVTIMIPLAFPLRTRNDIRIQRDEQSLGAAIKEASGHRGYCLLACGYFVCGFHVAFIAVHFPSYVVDSGLPAEVGAWGLAIMGLINILGGILAGLAGDRFSKKNCLCILYIARAVVISIFIITPISTASVLSFAFVFGFLWLSTVPLTTSLVAQIFGPRYMATLVGFVFFGHQLGSFTGVWLGGYLFDTTGSYEVVWWLGVALSVIAALVHWPIDERSLRPAEA